MDPITATLLEYHNHLREGGERPNLAAKYPHQAHVPARMFSASKQMLCDRAACYDVMHDLGEITKDIETPAELELDFRVGNLFEEYVAEALEWKGALVKWQYRLSAGNRKGRTDALVDPAKIGDKDGGMLWAVEIKTIKSEKSGLLADRAPYPYHIAQADWCATALNTGNNIWRPVLFYALRATFKTAIYTWRWDGDDALVQTWDGVFGWEYAKSIQGVKPAMEESRQAQTAWLETGELPPHIGETPEAHPFLCVNRDWDNMLATPSCPYYARCWNRPVEPFRISKNGRKRK